MQAASGAGVDATSKPSFFERTGKNAAQRSSMQMDICVQNITLYAGQVESSETDLPFLIVLCRLADQEEDPSSLTEEPCP